MLLSRKREAIAIDQVKMRSKNNPLKIKKESTLLSQQKIALQQVSISTEDLVVLGKAALLVILATTTCL